MKLLLLSLSVPLCVFAQTVTIGPVVFAGSGLNDASSGGFFSAAAANEIFVATISATGTPDYFTWTKNGGSASSPVAIAGGACALPSVAGSGGWQALADGVDICWLASTGHTLAAAWTINTQASGNAGTFVQTGVGSSVVRQAQDKLREIRSVLDAAPSGPDSAAMVQRAWDDACNAPAYEPQFAGGFGGRFINMPPPPTSAGYVTNSATLVVHCDNVNLGSLGSMVPLISSANPIVDFNGHSHVHMKGVFVQCDKTGTFPQIGVKIDSPSSDTTDNTFEDGYVLDCGIPPIVGHITGIVPGNPTVIDVSGTPAPSVGPIMLGGLPNESIWASLNGASGTPTYISPTSFSLPFNTTAATGPPTIPGSGTGPAWGNVSVMAGCGIAITGFSNINVIVRGTTFELAGTGICGSSGMDGAKIEDNFAGLPGITAASGPFGTFANSAGSANIWVVHNTGAGTMGGFYFGPNGGFFHEWLNWSEDLPGYWPVMNGLSAMDAFDSAQGHDALGNIVALHGLGANYAYYALDSDNGMFMRNTGLGPILQQWNNSVAGSAQRFCDNNDGEQLTDIGGLNQVYSNPYYPGICQTAPNNYQGHGTEFPEALEHLNVNVPGNVAKGYVPSSGQSTTLAAAISTPCPSTLTVASAIGIGPLQILWVDSGVKFEKVLVLETYVSGTTIPVLGGYQGTACQTHAMGVTVNWGPGGNRLISFSNQGAGIPYLSFGAEVNYVTMRASLLNAGVFNPVPIRTDLLDVQSMNPAQNTRMRIAQKIGGGQADYLLEVVDPTYATLYSGLKFNGSGFAFFNNPSESYDIMTTGGIMASFGGNDTDGRGYVGTLNAIPFDVLYNNITAARFNAALGTGPVCTVSGAFSNTCTGLAGIVQSIATVSGIITLQANLAMSGQQLQIASTGVTAGTYGTATRTPVFTVNAQGQLTSAATSSTTLATSGSATNSATTGITVSISCAPIVVASGGGTYTPICTGTVTDPGHAHTQN